MTQTLRKTTAPHEYELSEAGQLYPLRFEPLFRRYLWGGRRLESVLGKAIGEGDDYAESWETVDHGEDQSLIANGAWSGTSLQQLVSDHGEDLFGVHHPQDQFPLLFKFLDANRVLSVQVHPNDAQGAQLDPPDLGKTEAWVILGAEPGSKIYAGLKPGVDRDQLKAAIDAEETEACLHEFEPQVGDCIFIPAGTVHALGAGLVVAEIQQASDTTYRLFDWNRVDANGDPRQLHIAEALDVINYVSGPVNPVSSEVDTANEPRQLVNCDKFVLNQWSIDGDGAVIEGRNRFHLIAIIEGSVSVSCGTAVENLSLGQTILVPAACGNIHLTTESSAKLLEIHLP